jgi:hypothetical protein
MTVRVDRLESDVVPSPEPAAGGVSTPSGDWQELVRMRALAARLTRDRQRTRAEGQDD